MYASIFGNVSAIIQRLYSGTARWVITLYSETGIFWLFTVTKSVFSNHEMRLLQVSLCNAASEGVQQILSGNRKQLFTFKQFFFFFTYDMPLISFPDPKSFETAAGRIFPACVVLHQWDWYEYGSQGKYFQQSLSDICANQTQQCITHEQNF